MSGYDDIINLPYPRKPERMSNYDRAAQFAPFAALTGHGEAIAETARITESAVELSDDGIAILNEKLRKLEVGEQVSVIYFQPDSRKAGGAYVRYTGNVKKLDNYRSTLVMAEGAEILFSRIVDIIK
ncbi:MAG: hypothetical protein IJZ39_09740 [Oscillospiraceae bacterium]|nr:hypothetical protein [Oscillospiraceae bacterium]